jgi:hypothetical protein
MSVYYFTNFLRLRNLEMAHLGGSGLGSQAADWDWRSHSKFSIHGCQKTSGSHRLLAEAVVLCRDDPSIGLPPARQVDSIVRECSRQKLQSSLHNFGSGRSPCVLFQHRRKSLSPAYIGRKENSTLPLDGKNAKAFVDIFLKLPQMSVRSLNTVGKPNTSIITTLQRSKI